jgi:hypothetical protein
VTYAVTVANAASIATAVSRRSDAYFIDIVVGQRRLHTTFPAI